MALAALALLSAALLGCGEAPAPPGWVQGDVRIGPVSPVEQPGVVNDRPYSATLKIERAADGKTVTIVTSDANGYFKVELPSGRYRLVPQVGSNLSAPAPQEFGVSPGLVTSLKVDYDSGIR